MLSHAPRGNKLPSFASCELPLLSAELPANSVYHGPRSRYTARMTLITLETVRSFLSCPRAYAAGREENGLQRQFRDRCRSVLLSVLKSAEAAAGDAAPTGDSAEAPQSAAALLPHGAIALRYDVWYRCGDLAARADIVADFGGGKNALALVRAGTGSRRSHLLEAAYIRHVAALCGEVFTSVLLYHPEKGYTRYERSDSGQLFARLDISAAVDRLGAEVDRAVQRLRQLQRGELESAAPELRACGRTQVCSYCRSVLPEFNEDDPRTLFHGRQRGAELVKEGVVSLLKLPPSVKLSDKQRIQVEAVRERQRHIDRPALQHFLTRLEYPLHFLDFEAFSVPLPPWPGTRVWEHIPFLYTVQTVPFAGAAPVERHYCADASVDYRGRLVDRLAADIASEGSVVVYGRDLESRMLRRLADWVSHGAQAMLAIRRRLVDLAEPFQQFWLYDYRQRGSLSLKTLLPLLTGIDYRNLEIRNGRQANVLFADAVLSKSDVSTEQRRSLVSYCSRDTMGMVELAETLSRLCHENSGGNAVTGWLPGSR